MKQLIIGFSMGLVASAVIAAGQAAAPIAVKSVTTQSAHFGQRFTLVAGETFTLQSSNTTTFPTQTFTVPIGNTANIDIEMDASIQ
jgi:hypothetical protein